MEQEFIERTFVKGQLPESFGIRFEDIGKAGIKASLQIDERHLRPGGILNGGVSLVLIETLGSISACQRVDIEKQEVLGIQVSANHIGIARLGDTLSATSKARHVGRTTHIWEVTIVNQKNQLICNGVITCLIVSK